MLDRHKVYNLRRVGRGKGLVAWWLSLRKGLCILLQLSVVKTGIVCGFLLGHKLREATRDLRNLQETSQKN